jgi:rubrerythrin
MTNLRTWMWIALFAVVAGCMQSAILAADGGPALVTLDRLQAAYRAENIAQERYLAFAAKADEEGYKQAASLFRAVARAEQILYTYHFDAIKELGGVPAEVESQPPTVGSTKENLEKSSNKAEAEEFDSDYTTYVKAARAEGNRTAAKVLEYARIVEAQNVRLFAVAAKSLDQMRGGPKGYYICGVSGVVSPTLDAANCSGPDWERVR